MDEAALLELLSGRRTDVGARLLRCGLGVASWGYSSVMVLRNFAYDRRWIRIERVPVPVISVGNVTTGGTGKTPMVAWLANWLVDEGRKPGLLSRGYRSLSAAPGSLLKTGDRHGAFPQRVGDHQIPTEPVPAFQQDCRQSEGTQIGSQVFENDEKLVLDRLCPGIPHLQHRDRVNSAQRAVADFGCDSLVLDDGFQHRRLHRDLDLVLIDALQPWGYGHVLPRGLLRERVSGIRRGGLIVITRADQISPEQRDELLAQLRQIRGEEEIIEVAFRPRRLVDPNWNSISLESVKGKKAIGFCGIGNPDAFRKTVASLGVTCDEVHAFPDHHHYTPQDLMRIEKMATDSSVEIVLTTQKDLVKIPENHLIGKPLYAIEIGTVFVSGEELLKSRLRGLLGG